jgi:hypothetical protein
MRSADWFTFLGMGDSGISKIFHCNALYFFRKNKTAKNPAQIRVQDPEFTVLRPPIHRWESG